MVESTQGLQRITKPMQSQSIGGTRAIGGGIGSGIGGGSRIGGGAIGGGLKAPTRENAL